MIELKNVSRRFGSFYAVRDLTLSVPRGQIYSFLGPNGAGKTTSIKMLTGLLKPTAGEISVCGFDMERDALSAKKLIGYIPDMPFIYERLTPIEFLRFIGDLYGMPSRQADEEIEKMLVYFSLLDHKHALIKDFSHGMRQRLIYCATLMHNPEVLFIDEPLMGLDPHTIRKIKDLLRSKAAAGTAIFLTTHILALAEDISDRIGIISHGRLVAEGSAGELASRFGIRTGLEDIFLSLTENEGVSNVGGQRTD